MTANKRDTRYLAALIASLDHGHSQGTACTCPEHRIVAAYRRGDRMPPAVPDMGLLDARKGASA